MSSLSFFNLLLSVVADKVSKHTKAAIKVTIKVKPKLVGMTHELNISFDWSLTDAYKYSWVGGIQDHFASITVRQLLKGTLLQSEPLNDNDYYLINGTLSTTNVL